MLLTSSYSPSPPHPPYSVLGVLDSCSCAHIPHMPFPRACPLAVPSPLLVKPPPLPGYPHSWLPCLLLVFLRGHLLCEAFTGHSAYWTPLPCSYGKACPPSLLYFSLCHIISLWHASLSFACLFGWILYLECVKCSLFTLYFLYLEEYLALLGPQIFSQWMNKMRLRNTPKCHWASF